MKISAKQYAIALFEATSNLSETEMAAACGRFVSLLSQKRELGRFSEIAKELEKVFSSVNREEVADLVTARKINTATESLIASYLAKRLGLAQVRLRQSEDAKLLGGFVARIGDKVIDASLRSQLDALKNKINN